MSDARAVAGLLLTGGSSRRMGTDKAALRLEGETLAVRGARLLGAVCAPVLELGSGSSGLPAVREDPPGSGPLVALAAGAAALRDEGHDGPALLLAVDLPLITLDLLTRLVDAPGWGTVVPVVDGVPQTTCARYGARTLARAAVLVDAGERSLRSLLDDAGFEALDLTDYDGREVALFADVDTPEQARTLGLTWPSVPRPGEHDRV